MSEWISVKDRLPENDDNVLVIVNGKYNNVTFVNAMMIAAFCDDEHVWFLNEYPDFVHANVTHWMPLPEPPKEAT